MKLPKLTAVIEKETNWYIASCRELCVASQGRTSEAAELMLREAVELLLQAADETEIRRRLKMGYHDKKSVLSVRKSGRMIVAQQFTAGKKTRKVF